MTKNRDILGIGIIILLAIIPLVIWVRAYQTCTDDLCPQNRAVLAKNMFDLPVCMCAP
jgi:hypothetical protein